MRRELTHPGWLVLVLVILWGIAGKLDEPLEGFDPEPIALTDVALNEEAALPPIHLLCYLDEGHGGPNGPTPDAVVLTSFQPAQRGVAADVSVASRRLQCVVTND